MSKRVRQTKALVGVRTFSSDDITYVANVIIETFFRSRDKSFKERKFMKIAKNLTRV